MRFIAELLLEHPKLVLTPTIERCPGMDIELEYQLIATEGSYILLFHVRGDDFEAFETVLAEDPTVTDISTMISTPAFRVYRTHLVSTEYLVLATAVEMGLRLIEAVSDEGAGMPFSNSRIWTPSNSSETTVRTRVWVLGFANSIGSMTASAKRTD
ncbi:bacterio-opsin activator domain-containing protein [Halohasta litchfieldiae]|uniref:Bacterioopsin transcriptional activator GAF and HTH associated domain-containing protein n=1 Tax=Halohasta litchfieldiae TaxID=1073996 RepID=A0A1H6TKY5_9EURY|nr:hypothetical protein [Halohasta litchfieldiae]SEI76905.1 hypothetical protein SAMN05444271_107143 [Halohasta litchfieldiae]